MTRFAIKHAVATVVVMATVAGLLTVGYIGLLAAAVISGGGVGSPVTLPATIVLLLVAITLAVLFVFVPATMLAEWLCARTAWPRLVQIPLAMLFAAVAVAIEVLTIAWFQDASVARGAWASLVIFAILLIPLGLYWWALQAADVLIGAVVRRWRASWPANLPVSRHLGSE